MIFSEDFTNLKSRYIIFTNVLSESSIKMFMIFNITVFNRVQCMKSAGGHVMMVWTPHIYSQATQTW